MQYLEFGYSNDSKHSLYKQFFFYGFVNFFVSQILEINFVKYIVYFDIYVAIKSKH